MGVPVCAVMLTAIAMVRYTFFMANITFDTLAAARALEDAGIEQEQARAIADQLQVAASGKVEDLASKADLGVLRADLAELRADLYRALWIQGGTLATLMIAGFAAVGFS